MLHLYWLYTLSYLLFCLPTGFFSLRAPCCHAHCWLFLLSAPLCLAFLLAVSTLSSFMSSLSIGCFHAQLFYVQPFYWLFPLSAPLCPAFLLAVSALSSMLLYLCIVPTHSIFLSSIYMGPCLISPIADPPPPTFLLVIFAFRFLKSSCCSCYHSHVFFQYAPFLLAVISALLYRRVFLLAVSAVSVLFSRALMYFVYAFLHVQLGLT
jgi:hypothetical protein